MSQEKEAQIKFYKTREDKEIEKVIALENKVKALDDIVYKIGQSVQTMNMLNRNYKMSFVKPEFLKKAQRANPRLYDIGCYNDNLALMLTPEYDETIRAPLYPILHCILIPLQLIEIILFIIDSGCSKYMTRNLKLLSNFVEKFLGTVKFGNDQIAPILGYGDLGNDILTAWLWHRLLSHLNFDTINLLLKYDIVTGLPKLKFVKDHLCSSCELGKAKHKSFKTKNTPSSKRRLQILHMDLCGPMRVESFNGKKYVLVIVDDYSRFTWTHFLRSKDETPEVLINFLKLVQKGLHAQFFHIFGSLCYIVIDGENLDKMKEKGDACVFVGYSTQSRAYRVYNKRTRVIVEPIHVNFDELPQMASDHVSSDPVPQCLTTELEHANLSLGPQSQENVPHSVELVTTPNELDLLFSLMFDELLNVTTQVMSKSSAVTIADAPNQRQQQHTTSSTSTTAVTENVPQAAETVTMSNELDLLFSPMFDELLNGTTPVVSKSSAVHTDDAHTTPSRLQLMRSADSPPLNIQTTPVTKSQEPTQVQTVSANKNIIQAETNKENAQVDDDEFINVFSTPVQDTRDT
ncbi:retrovirus-related pol polyprotein from transposon TNT 1-94 [Tanacetum coccineum]